MAGGYKGAAFYKGAAALRLYPHISFPFFYKGYAALPLARLLFGISAIIKLYKLNLCRVIIRFCRHPFSCFKRRGRGMSSFVGWQLNFSNMPGILQRCRHSAACLGFILDLSHYWFYKMDL